jgi:hypothetical protein
VRHSSDWQCRRLVARLLSCALASTCLFSCVGDAGPSGPAFGSINITTATSGPEPDTDGYTLIMEGAEGQPIANNGTLTIENLVPRTYRVELAGVPSNCAVRQGALQAVSVEAGGTVEVSFEVACASEPLPEPPVARLTITAAEGDRSVNEGGEMEITVPPSAFMSFSFDASRSEAGAGSAIVAYEWQSNGVTVGTDPSFTLELDEGTYAITLKVTNSAGLNHTAGATLDIVE